MCSRQEEKKMKQHKKKFIRTFLVLVCVFCFDCKRSRFLNKSTHKYKLKRFFFQFDLRGIKTPEELALVKKAVVISSIAHAEAMRAVKPSMSERELEGIMRYVHDKYGAEEEGYPPIVGAGANGCILHYEENNVTQIKNHQGY